MPVPDPPTLPPDVSLQRLPDVPLTDALGSFHGPAWAVVRGGRRLGIVHLGRTCDRLETIPGKPPRLAWMVHPEATEYTDRSHAAWGLLRNQRSNSNEQHDSNERSNPRSNSNEQHDSNERSNTRSDDNEDERSELDDDNRATTATATALHQHVSNDRLPRPFSASQIKKYVECPRKWGWQYLEGIKPKSTAAAELGKEVHAILEEWLQQGTPPDPRTKPGKIAAAMVKCLPTPGKHLEVERKFQFELRGHQYRGFVDLGYWEKALRVVHDHKTTGDLMWALTEEELIHDVQAILYAKEAMDRFDVDEVKLSWLYARTRSSPKPTPRVTVIHRDDVESGIEVIETYTNEMAEIRKKKLPVLELEPHVMACGNFGGCDFIGKCQLTARQKRKAIFAQEKKKMSLKEKMQARRTTRKGKKSAERSRPVAVPDEPEEVDEEITEEAEEEEGEEEEVQEKEERAPKKKKKKGRLSRPKDKKKTSSSKKKASSKKKSSTKAKSKPEPEINPPESPDEEEQVKPLSKEEEEAKKEAEKGGKKKSKAGRPKGAKNKTSDITDREAFVQIFSAAVGSANRNALELAAEVWALFQKEFGE